MKPVAFKYERPARLEEACALLAGDPDARILAGGQPLIPMLAMRLSRPTCLVDIARIPDLAGIRSDGDALTVGATTRQSVAEVNPLVTDRLPLLAKALPWVGHAPTRSRGTVGGSIANGDPAAEIALVAVTLDATLIAQTSEETTDLSAGEFYLGPMITALPEGAILTAVKFPVWKEDRVGSGFLEVSARRSDFALVAAAAQVAIDGDGHCTRLAIGIGGASDTPARLNSCIDPLIGSRLDERTVREAVGAAVDDLETVADLHASAAYRKRVAATLACRAVAQARDDATGGTRAH